MHFYVGMPSSFGTLRGASAVLVAVLSRRFNLNFKRETNYGSCRDANGRCGNAKAQPLYQISQKLTLYYSICSVVYIPVKQEKQ